MDLAKSAMLVSVNITNGGLLGERKDRQASQLVETTYSIAQKRAKASKYLIDRNHKSVRAVVAASQRVREVMYKYTMPWGDEKVRLLPVDLYETFKEKVSQAEADLRAAWDDYLIAYPSLIAASEVDLGGLFDRNQYPSVAETRDLFSYRLNFWPIPESGHFVANIAQKAADEAKKAIEGEIEERLLDTTMHLVDRVRETVTKFVDKMSTLVVVEPTGEVTALEGIFRDSLINNCRDVANLVDSMNLAQNPKISEIVRDLRRMASYTADELREDRIFRVESLRRGQSILKKLDNIKKVDRDTRELIDEVSETSDYF